MVLRGVPAIPATRGTQDIPVLQDVKDHQAIPVIPGRLDRKEFKGHLVIPVIPATLAQPGLSMLLPNSW